MIRARWHAPKLAVGRASLVRQAGTDEPMIAAADLKLLLCPAGKIVEVNYLIDSGALNLYTIHA